MPPLPTSRFDFPVPERLIARMPAARRDASRLLVVDRASRRLEHRTFAELGDFLRPGDLLVRNNASVLPARLRALRPTGGQVECLLLQPLGGGERWRCLVRPGRKLAPGATFTAPGGEFSGRIEARREDGTAEVAFTTASGESLTAVANRVGAVPLPPYIERARETAGETNAGAFPDRERYQTVYAEPSRQVAAAARLAEDDDQTRRVTCWQQFARYARQAADYRERALDAANAGGDYAIGKQRIAVVESTPQRFVYHKDGRNVRISPRADVPGPIVTAILRAWFAAADQPGNHVFLGTYLLARSEPNARLAAAEWNLAGQRGEDVSNLEPLLQDPIIRAAAAE